MSRSSMPPDLSIVIVSYNTKDATLACVRSVIEQTRTVSYEIIVIDNASLDGSADAIRSECPQVSVISSTDNLGFGRANNVASKMARGRRLLLLNPDTVVQNGALDALVDFANHRPHARIWGGRATFLDGRLNPSCLGDITLWSTLSWACGLTYLFPESPFFNPEYIHMWDRLDHERDVDIVVGCFLLIDKALWDALEGFNPDFFMYGEEVDLCLRARKLGARPRITPSATIIHFGGASEPSTEDKTVKILKGRITVMRVHWHVVSLHAAQWTLLATVALRALASRVIRPAEQRGLRFGGHADLWSGVFRRRDEWLNGWPPTS